MTPGVYRPAETDLPPGEEYCLTPVPGPVPKINGPSVYGVRPDRPVLFTVPVTGERPLTFRADDLPPTLTLDSQTGIITGSVPAPGRYEVTLQVENARGKSERVWTLVVGEELALTPPMGWNSWNCWSHNVSEENVRASAQALVDSGLIDHGWSSVNIDDAWQGHRGGVNNALQANEKFPDLAALCHDLHRLGLKVGIYSTPWVTTYAGFNGGSSDEPDGRWQPIEGWDNYRVHHRVGTHRFEAVDARQFAEWGFDYLKYDWNPNDADCTASMARELRKSGRDIVFSLSNTAPLELAETWQRAAQAWRTTGDIRDAWNRTDLPENEQWSVGLMDIADQHEKWAPFNGPGHWCDADMLVVGQVGWGRLRGNHLSPDELYTHVSLWCLWSSPLLIGCPLDSLDDFTRNLLTNDDVLALNQDVLGRQALRVASGAYDVWVKPLADGAVAVGFVNRINEIVVAEANLEQLGFTGSVEVRDLWRQRSIGVYQSSFACAVRPHGTVLARLSP